MQKNTNSQLKEIYQKHWDGLLKNSTGIPAASPLLIQLRDEYWNADVKVMICGQETYGWNGNVGGRDVDFLMNDYEAVFYNDQKYFDENKDYGDYSRAIGKYKNKGRLKRKKSRNFWNKKNFEFFEKELIKYFKDEKVGFVWNNLSKIGNSTSYKQGKGKAIKSVRNLERGHFNVFMEEFKILNPDIVIFTTGSRDGYIKHHFGKSDVKFLPKLCLENNIVLEKTLNLIAEVKLPNFDNVCALRVGHPSRRTLHNEVILTIFKQLWESRQIIGKNYE